MNEEDQILAALAEPGLATTERLRQMRLLRGAATERSVDILGELTRNADRRVRVDALRILRSVGGMAAIDVLCNALSHEDVVTAGWAALFLGELGAEGAVPALIETADERWSSLGIARPWVVRALGLLGDLRAMPVLERGLRSKDANVRVQAAYALSKMDPADTGGSVQAALSDLSWWRGRAVRRGVKAASAHEQSK